MPVELKIPSVGESITEVVVGTWRKSVGDFVTLDEDLVELETDKATFDLPAPAAGVITKILKQAGETAMIGDVIGYIGPAGEVAPSSTPAKAVSASPSSAAAPTKGAVLTGSDKNATDHPPTRDILAAQPVAPEPFASPTLPAQRSVDAIASNAPVAVREEKIVAMSPIRRRIAQRLVEAQQNAALLTTFNEIDMSSVIDIRKKYRDAFQENYGVKLGFMSFFVKAVVAALAEVPQVNAEVRGNNIVYRNYFDIGIAVGGGKGLVVPVLRNAEQLSFAEIERVIADFGRRAGQNQLKVDELQGGTFTISNGGVYGSLMSTPIVNPPQSGVLGMHAIQDRPVVREGNIVIRPMMYVALSYDHRIIDGREAVTFLNRVREIVEDPSRLLIEI